MKTQLILAVLGLAVALTGCSSLGPRTIASDRFEYSASIGDSWKRQTLLNIVKLRYLDPPIFVDVGQIVSGYSLEIGGSAAAQVARTGAGDTFIGVGGHQVYTDRPTITYTPLTGDKFIKSLMTPLTPESVVFMIQSGYAADAVLLAATASINGLQNQETTLSGTTPPDAAFIRVLTLLRKIQISGAVAFRVQQDAENKQTTLVSIRREDIPPETLADSMELRRLLRLDPDENEFTLVLGATPANDKEVAMRTRSVIQLLQTLSGMVDVPAEHVAEAPSGWESVAEQGAVRLIAIHSSDESPPNAFVAVNYRGHFFWIDNQDLESKRTFSFMMMLFTLADTSEKPPLPQITIPAQ